MRREDSAGGALPVAKGVGCFAVPYARGKGSGAPVGNRNAVKHGAFDKEMRQRAAELRSCLAEMREVEKALDLR